MKALRGVMVLVLALALPAPVLAADLQVGEEALDRGDYATALGELRPLAEQGNARAQQLLGSIYFGGKGVSQDYAEAVKWWHLAAERGSVEAQFSLGYIYEHGEGVPRDYVSAHMWFNLAAARSKPGEFRDFQVSVLDRLEKKMAPAQIAEAQRLAGAALMIHDLDIYRSANVLIREHGDEAVIAAVKHADAMLAKGDLEGQVVWKRIVRAVEEIQREEPVPGEAIQ